MYPSILEPTQAKVLVWERVKCVLLIRRVKRWAKVPMKRAG
jgi:hypothetical protein